MNKVFEQLIKWNDTGDGFYTNLKVIGAAAFALVASSAMFGEVSKIEPEAQKIEVTSQNINDDFIKCIGDKAIQITLNDQTITHEVTDCSDYPVDLP